jgi:aquaporin Z
VASETEIADSRLEWRRLIAETIGTFFLVLVAAGGGTVDAAYGGGRAARPAAVIATALVLLALIRTLRGTSGAHLNPAITVALATSGSFAWRRVPGYLIAQLAGATAAAGVLRAAFGRALAAGCTAPGPGTGAGTALAVEVLLTFGLMTVILGTASGPHVAIAVAGYVALAGLWGSPVSGASMNPARSLGPALVSGRFTDIWIYLAGPVAGGLIAVAVAWTVRRAPSPAAHEA